MPRFFKFLFVSCDTVMRLDVGTRIAYHWIRIAICQKCPAVPTLAGHFLFYHSRKFNDMKIQFKKLVWTPEDDNATACSTGLFEFVIFKNDHQPFMVEIYSVTGFEVRMIASSIDDAKQKAQNWFETQLIQFIETSETPAQ